MEVDNKGRSSKETGQGHHKIMAATDYQDNVYGRRETDFLNGSVREIGKLIWKWYRRRMLEGVEEEMWKRHVTTETLVEEAQNNKYGG